MVLRRTGSAPVKELARAAFWILVMLVALVSTPSAIVRVVALSGLVIVLSAAWTILRPGPESPSPATERAPGVGGPGADDTAVATPGPGQPDKPCPTVPEGGAAPAT